MYSLIRSWIGANDARMLIQVRVVVSDDEGQRQAVDAELVLDAEQRDPGDLLDELEARVARRGEARPAGSARTRPRSTSAAPSATPAGVQLRGSERR